MKPNPINSPVLTALATTLVTLGVAAAGRPRS